MSLIRVRDKEGNYIDIPALQGESAYDIAVRNGYTGTEQEWLESMGFANYVVLNKLGDSNGKLTYDGKVVGGRQTATVTLQSNDFYLVDTDVSYTTMIIVNDTSKIPENSEITSIELNSGTADSPVWINARDMIADYPTAPYMLSFNRFKFSASYSGYLLVSIFFPLQDKNDLIISLDKYEIPQIRVTYYI